MLVFFIYLSIFSADNSLNYNELGKESQQEIKLLSEDFYESSKEFMAEIESMASNEKYFEKINIGENFESLIENLSMLEAANRDRSIELFEAYLKKYSVSDYTPDVLYRLAQLYFENDSIKYIKDQERYQKLYEDFKSGKVSTLPKEPKIDYSHSINTIKILNKRYPDYKFRDMALYLQGYAYFEQGDIDITAEIFEKLADEYPNSNKLPEIYTRLGEYYFDFEMFEKAISYYSHVLEYPDSVYYDKILYKLAWSYYKLRKIKKMADYFTSVIDFQDRKYGKENNNTLKREAINYITIGFTEHAGGIVEVYNYFRSKGNKYYENEIMQKVVELYTLSDRIKQAEESISFILQKYPNNENNPEIFNGLIEAYERTGRTDAVLQLREKLVKYFGDNSSWRKNNSLNIMAIINANKIIEKNIIASALYYQGEGDKSNNYKYYIKAGSLYNEFLNKYYTSYLAVGARHNYAQVLFNLMQYDDAIIEFNRVINLDKENTYLDNSSYNIVLSNQNILKQSNKEYLSNELTVLKGKDAKLLPAKKLDAREQALVDSCSKYEELNPKGTKSPTVWYLKAEVFFRNNDFENARLYYKKIIANFPKERISIDSIKNIIASYNHEENYAEVQAWSKRLLKSGAISKSKKEMTEIRGLLTGSLFKTAKQLESENKQVDAAMEYIRLANQYPKSSYSSAALYNAAFIYENINKPIDAINTYDLLISRYPKTKFGSNAMYRIAVNYEYQLEFDKALSTYQKIIAKYKSGQVTIDSFYNIARLYRANNEYTRAAANLIAYFNREKDLKEKNLAILQAAKLYERSKDYSKAINLYLDYIKINSKDLDAVMESYIMIGRLYIEMNNDKTANSYFNKAIASYKASGSPTNSMAKHYAAEAIFRSLQIQVSEYESIKIGKNISKMEAIYSKKDKIYNTLMKEYIKVILLSSAEWSIASLYMLGYLSQDFANFLFEAPVPKELNTEELIQEYQSQLQMKAMPYEDTSIENYEKCISEATRLKVINDWSKKARYSLSILKPDEYKVEKEGISQSSPTIEIIDYGFIGDIR